MSSVGCINHFQGSFSRPQLTDVAPTENSRANVDRVPHGTCARAPLEDRVTDILSQEISGRLFSNKQC